jgi:epsilon-lactone hydrolase
MASVRARAANLVFRRCFKRTFERGHSVESLRSLVQRFDRHAARPPRGISTIRLELGDFEAERIATPHARGDRVLLYLPGGGFVARSPALHRGLVARICAEAQAEALLAFYRLAPENPFPAALEDCVAAYHHLLEQGSSPSGVVIGGDSAGGCLTLATLMALRDRGTPLPAAAFTLSAVTDLRSHANGSRTENRLQDPVLSIDHADKWHRYYVAHEEFSLTDPLVSPVLGDFSGLPPLLMQASTTEILLDDSRLAAAAACAAGVDCTLELFHGVAHVWHALPYLPESRRAVRSIGSFVRAHAGA